MALADLINELERQGSYDGSKPESVVGLELFFEGNNDPDSIGQNFVEHPGIDTMYRVLGTIRDRPQVHDVLVAISQVGDEDQWPFSDHVYVITDASTDELAAWAQPLDTDYPAEGWWDDQPPRQPVEIPGGSRVLTLWWD